MADAATMNYYTSAKGSIIGRERVIKELKDHGIVNCNEFFNEVKPRKDGLY